MSEDAGRSYVLVIEPDQEQARIAKRVITDLVHARAELARTYKDAIKRLAADPPDLILTSAFLSPSEEIDLTERLRGLRGGAEILTLAIPPLSDDFGGGQRAGLSPLKRLKGRLAGRAVNVGAIRCSPISFAGEVRLYLERSREARRWIDDSDAPSIAAGQPAAEVNATAPDFIPDPREDFIPEAGRNIIPDSAAGTPESPAVMVEPAADAAAAQPVEGFEPESDSAAVADVEPAVPEAEVQIVEAFDPEPDSAAVADVEEEVGVSEDGQVTLASDAPVIAVAAEPVDAGESQSEDDVEPADQSADAPDVVPGPIAALAAVDEHQLGAIQPAEHAEATAARQSGDAAIGVRAALPILPQPSTGVISTHGAVPPAAAEGVRSRDREWEAATTSPISSHEAETAAGTESVESFFARCRRAPASEEASQFLARAVAGALGGIDLSDISEAVLPQGAAAARKCPMSDRARPAESEFVDLSDAVDALAEDDGGPAFKPAVDEVSNAPQPAVGDHRLGDALGANDADLSAAPAPATTEAARCTDVVSGSSRPPPGVAGLSKDEPPAGHEGEHETPGDLEVVVAPVKRPPPAQSAPKPRKTTRPAATRRPAVSLEEILRLAVRLDPPVRCPEHATGAGASSAPGQETPVAHAQLPVWLDAPPTPIVAAPAHPDVVSGFGRTTACGADVVSGFSRAGNVPTSTPSLDDARVDDLATAVTMADSDLWAPIDVDGGPWPAMAFAVAVAPCAAAIRPAGEDRTARDLMILEMIEMGDADHEPASLDARAVRVLEFLEASEPVSDPAHTGAVAAHDQHAEDARAVLIREFSEEIALPAEQRPERRADAPAEPPAAAPASGRGGSSDPPAGVPARDRPPAELPPERSADLSALPVPRADRPAYRADPRAAAPASGNGGAQRADARRDAPASGRDGSSDPPAEVRARDRPPAELRATAPASGRDGSSDPSADVVSGFSRTPGSSRAAADAGRDLRAEHPADPRAAAPASGNGRALAPPERRDVAPPASDTASADELVDEWGFYNSDQCGWKALLARIEAPSGTAPRAKSWLIDVPREEDDNAGREPAESAAGRARPAEEQPAPSPAATAARPRRRSSARRKKNRRRAKAPAQGDSPPFGPSESMERPSRPRPANSRRKPAPSGSIAGGGEAAPPRPRLRPLSSWARLAGETRQPVVDWRAIVRPQVAGASRTSGCDRASDPLSWLLIPYNVASVRYGCSRDIRRIRVRAADASLRPDRPLATRDPRGAHLAGLEPPVYDARRYEPPQTAAPSISSSLDRLAP